MTQEQKINYEFIEYINGFREPDRTKGLVENGNDNIVVFAEYMLGMRLRAWQCNVLLTLQAKAEYRAGLEVKFPDFLKNTDEYVIMTSRQIGKSTLLGIFAIWSCVYNKVPGTLANNTIFGVVSASDVQAKKLLYEMKKIMNMGDRHMEVTYRDDNDKPIFGKKFFNNLVDENEPNNTTKITFKSYNSRKHGKFLLGGEERGSKTGSMIKSYPPTSVVLGETFTVVVIDEAGKTDKITDTFFVDYMYPTGNSTEAIRVYTSTPWETSGFFYRLVDPDGMYGTNSAYIFSYTIEDIKIEAPHAYKKIMEIIDAMLQDGKTDEVQRAYYCRFVKGQKAFFDPEKVLQAFTSSYSPFSYYKEECDMGIDFGGQVNSRTVVTISALHDNGNVYRIYHHYYEVGQDETLIEDISDLMKRFNVQRIIPDDCAAGHHFIKLMEQKGWNVQPMNFRKEKVKKYGAFRSFLNRSLIYTYEDSQLQKEMLAIETSEKSKQSRIEAPPGYSDDFIDSFLMSTYFFIEEEDGVKVFDWDADFTQFKKGVCPACGGKKVMNLGVQNECKECGRVWEKST